MDKFVIGRVVTAIDYTLTQFSIKLAVAATLTTRLSSLFMAVLSSRQLHTARMHCSSGVRNWTFVLVRRNHNQRISLSDKRIERGIVPRAD
jgi:hypothetical protein